MTITDAWKTAMEEGWRRSIDCERRFMEDIHEPEVVDSALKHGLPPFYNVETGEFSSEPDWFALLKANGITVYGDDFRIPATLGTEGNRIAREFRALVAKTYENPSGGGCDAFRDPYFQSGFEGVEKPQGAVLAIVYDGGDIAPFLNPSYECYELVDKAYEFFNTRGYVCEPHLHWWAWVFKD